MTIPNFKIERRARVWLDAPWERYEGRGVIASALALAALTAAATSGGGIVAGHIASRGQQAAADTQARATSDATAKQLEAERLASEAQLKASREQLDYEKRAATQNRADAETNREGDYEQWAAREGRLSTIGGMLGMPAREIPAYRPLGPDLSADGAGGTGSGAASSAARMPKQGEINWTAPPDQLGAQLTKYFTDRGVPTTEVPYWVKQAGELSNRAQQLGDPLYGDKRLAAAEIFGNAAPGRSSAQRRTPYGSIGAITTPEAGTPAYVAPTIYTPGSIRQIAA